MGREQKHNEYAGDDGMAEPCVATRAQDPNSVADDGRASSLFLLVAKGCGRNAPMNPGPYYEAFEFCYADHPDAMGWNRPLIDEQVWQYMRRLLELLVLPDQITCLEIGCGMGSHTRRLAEFAHRVIAVDISPTAISRAQLRDVQSGLSTHYHCLNLVTDPLPCGAQQVDIIVDSLCLHCIIGSDRSILLSKLWAALSPHGHLLVVTMCDDPVPAMLTSRYDPVSRCIVRDNRADVFLGRGEDIQKELRNHRFEPVHVETIPADIDTESQTLLLGIYKKVQDAGTPAGLGY